MQLQNEQYEFSGKTRTISLALIAVGVICVAVGFLTGDTERTWANLLLNNYYMVLIAFAGVMYCAIQYVAQAGWGTNILRVPQAFMSVVPLAAISLTVVLAVGLGTHQLYHHWADPALSNPESPSYDPLIAGKTSYMNVPLFMLRVVGFMAIWGFFAWKLRQFSLKEDFEGGLRYFKKGIVYSAIFCAIFNFTFPLFAFDVIMSLEPHWFSTMFGWYNLAALWVSGLAAIGLVVTSLKEKGYFTAVNENHIHDIGKFVFAFSIFWAYIFVAQMLLIWYANIPEEVTWFYRRWTETYKFWFWFSFVLNFFAPFMLFMTRDSKRKLKTVKYVCLLVIVAHWFDLYMMVMPGMMGTGRKFGYLELGTFLGYAGLFTFMALTALSKAPLYAKNHPYMEESLHHHI